jgi:hypothetical protein
MQLIVVSATVAKVAVSAGSIVMSLDVVIVLLQLSVNVQVSVYVPPQLLCEPVITEVTEPLIAQLPDWPLLYERTVGNGALAIQLIVVSLTAANVAVSAGRMVISLLVVMVLLQLSVNVQVSV